MIPEQWYAVLDSRELPRRRPVGVRRLGRELVFWRTTDGVSCAADRCAHRGAALSAGELADDRLRCPFHGFEYDARGRCRLIPANGRAAEVPERFQLRTLPALEREGLVFVWLGEGAPDPPEPPFFDELLGRRWGGFQESWPVHYSRVVENQLDLAHLPFVHRTTIGRAGLTLVEGPRCRLEADRLLVWFDNARDRGVPPRDAAELGPPTGPPLLSFRFPNLWWNRIGDRFGVFAAFAPVDDENTMIYLRFYQRIVRLPPFRRLFNFLANLYNRRILRQDRRVVVTQRPRRSSRTSDEMLIAADKPIVLYRRRRAELQRQLP